MKKKTELFIILLLVVVMACDRNTTPKPAGYLRVIYPEKEYVLFDDALPYAFELPAYARIAPHRSARSEPYWYDVDFPAFNATLHLSYKQVGDQLDVYVEDTRTLVYKHASQSDGISEVPFMDTSGRRFGILYDLEGNVASPVQFFLTDSTDHFLRGSLYFNTAPDRDSLRPVIRFVRQDVEHLMETLQWK